MLTLDVLIPSHNRGPYLERAAVSVLCADPAPDLDVCVVPVLNGCTDDSEARLRAIQASYPDRVRIIVEPRLGKSKALNAGIGATRGNLVGMIDDDEEVDARWLGAIARAFSDGSVDYAGGPYVARLPGPLPDWIPGDYLAVLGVTPVELPESAFGAEFPGILKGGNAVIRRSTLETVGPYAEHLGPGAASRLFSCEDEDMYLRLIAAGARGRYLPDLVIYHHVFPERLRPEYYRRWCFWRGVSRGLMDRRHPLPVKYLGGVPRFLYGEAVRGAGRMMAHLVRRRQRSELRDELRIWDLAGYLYGKHVYPLARFLPTRSRRHQPPGPLPHAERNSPPERQPLCFGRRG